MKRLFVAVLTAALLLSLCLPAFAQSGTYILDQNDVLSSIDEAETMAEEIYAEYGVCPMFATCTLETDEEAEAFADAVMEQNASAQDAILLLDCGSWLHVYTYGDAVARFSGQLQPCLDAYNYGGSYEDSVLAYLDQVKRILGGPAAEEPEPQPETESAAPLSPIQDGNGRVLVVDDADLLSDDEETKLLTLAEEISQRQQYDVAVLVTDSLGNEDINAFAEKYYNDNNYGFSPFHYGILFVVSVDQKVYKYYTPGFGLSYFTDDSFRYISERVYPLLNEGNYYDCFENYFKICDELLTRAKHKVLVIDDAGLLTESEKTKLLAMAEEISTKQQCDVAVVTNWSLDGKDSQTYADDYFDYNGYGYGENHDGILLLVSMEERDYAITTTGYGITAFTDYGLDYLVDRILPDLSDGDYYDCFRTYFETCDDLLTQARNGTPYDVHTSDGLEGQRLRRTIMSPAFLLVALGLGFLLSLIPLAILKSQVKNVKWNRDAGNYVKNDSLVLNNKRDVYLYANTTSRVIDTGNRGSGGGGSTTHFGSSGISHGGTHGKF